MAVVRSPDFLRALIRETALATLIHQRRLTPSCGGQAPTAERTVGPARMIAESLTPKPGIREHNLPRPDSCTATNDVHRLTVASSTKIHSSLPSMRCEHQLPERVDRNKRANVWSSAALRSDAAQ